MEACVSEMGGAGGASSPEPPPTLAVNGVINTDIIRKGKAFLKLRGKKNNKKKNRETLARDTSSRLGMTDS